MNVIRINSDSFKKHCDFIKENTTHKTNTKLVREAVRHYYLQVREESKEDLKKRLEELEK